MKCNGVLSAHSHAQVGCRCSAPAKYHIFYPILCEGQACRARQDEHLRLLIFCLKLFSISAVPRDRVSHRSCISSLIHASCEAGEGSRKMYIIACNSMVFLYLVSIFSNSIHSMIPTSRVPLNTLCMRSMYIIDAFSDSNSYDLCLKMD